MADDAKPTDPKTAKDAPAADKAKGKPNVGMWIGAGIGAGIGSAAIAAALLYATRNKKPKSAAKD